MNTSPLKHEEKAWSAVLNHSDVFMKGPGSFKTITKETRGDRNVAPTENAVNLMDCNKNSVWRS